MTRYPIIKPLVALYTTILGMNCIEGAQTHLCRKYYATNTNNDIVTRKIGFLLESSMFEQTQVANSINLVPAILYQTSPIGMLSIPTILWLQIWAYWNAAKTVNKPVTTFCPSEPNNQSDFQSYLRVHSPLYYENQWISSPWTWSSTVQVASYWDQDIIAQHKENLSAIFSLWLLE